MDVKLKPDLVITGETGIDDLIDLLESNKTELYSFGTLLSFFVEAGYEAIVPILIQGIVNDDK